MSTSPSDSERASTVEQKVRSFLAESAPANATEILAVGADQPVWGLVGSLNLLEMVDYVEQEFSVTVHPLEFIPENFATIEKIVTFTTSRMKG